MAKSKGNTATSVITALWKERNAIFQRNITETPDLDLTAHEQERVDAIDTVIANTTAANRREADIQMSVARGYLDRACDDIEAPPTITAHQLRSVDAALRSAGAVYDRKRAA
jgi:hypothetical protein